MFPPSVQYNNAIQNKLSKKNNIHTFCPLWSCFQSRDGNNAESNLTSYFIPADDVVNRLHPREVRMKFTHEDFFGGGLIVKMIHFNFRDGMKDFFCLLASFFWRVSSRHRRNDLRVVVIWGRREDFCWCPSKHWFLSDRDLHMIYSGLRIGEFCVVFFLLLVSNWVEERLFSVELIKIDAVNYIIYLVFFLILLFDNSTDLMMKHK